jgi:hypothetical protein
MKKLNCRPKIFLSTLMTIFTVSAIVIIIICTSCCIDLDKYSKSGSVEITFSGDEIDAAKIDELLDKYNIDLEDSASPSDNQNQDIDYTAIKKELADASNYRVSAEEEEDFFNNLEKIYDEETFILVKDYLGKFKTLYPSGYFTLVKVTQKQDYTVGYGWFELLNDNKSHSIEEITEGIEELEGFEDFDVSVWTPDFYQEYTGDINVIVHELTHCGSGPFIYLFVQELKDNSFLTDYSYMIGNLLIFIEKDKMLFSKYELFQDIENPDSFDKTYLDPDRIISTIEGEEVKGSDIDFTMILDEINAYTVSEKCVIATEGYMDQSNSSNERYGLLKQMSYLELYLKRCYEKYPEDWKYLTGHKELAFLIMKLWQEAEKFETAVKDDSRFNLNSKGVSEFVYNPDNYKIIEMFFGQSGILEYKNKNFKEIDAEFDNLRVYDINDL